MPGDLCRGLRVCRISGSFGVLLWNLLGGVWVRVVELLLGGISIWGEGRIVNVIWVLVREGESTEVFGH